MCLTNSQAYRLILFIKKIYQKYNLSHLLLLLSYAVFIVVSAAAFFVLESLHSEEFYRKWQQRLENDRNSFVVKEILPEIFNNTKLLLYIHMQKSQYLTSIINKRLELYESQLKLRAPTPVMPWTFINSLLFVFSTITSIGYGYTYPVTKSGRMLFIVISLIGIPFTIIVIKDISYIITRLMNLPCELLARCWNAFRFCTLQPFDEEELERKLHYDHNKDKDYRLHSAERLLAIPVTVATMALIGWVSIGCLIMNVFMPNHDTSANLYFIFNSLATIGMSDIELGQQPLLIILLSMYLLIGLSIVSLFMNLLHTKFSRGYWWQGGMYIPLRSYHLAASHMLGSFDSYEELDLNNDCPLNNMTTLGVLQIDNKCSLLQTIKSDFAYMDANTQTEKTVSNTFCLPSASHSSSTVMLPIPHTSHEDVNSLIVETYGVKPARLISCTRK
ncbi:Ion channel [Dictyocaulus viviparus]|uniref:Ion channel n=1 Tax=Dictyocaulus viviparus TaxID=29172 RepID=A0A0D8XAK7_DICVI|nr:Ion channel [Dictyocaulus viviparus]